MPYIDLINDYSQKNNYAYGGHEALFEQVREAMKKSGQERSAALRDVLKRNYIADAEKYEPMRKQFIKELWGVTGDTHEKLLERAEKMAGAPQFLEEYVSIIHAMAKDIDDKYEPEFMLGMDAGEAKNYVSAHLNTYTCYDQTVHSLQQEGWEAAMELVRSSTYSKVKDEYRNYATSNETRQGNMKETYVRKEHVKKQLKNMGFFKKYFSEEGRNMRKYVKAAESALTKVGFTERAAKEAEIEFGRTATLENEYEACYKYMDKKFKAHAEEKNDILKEQATNLNNQREQIHFEKDEIDTSIKMNDVNERVSEPPVKNDVIKNM